MPTIWEAARDGDEQYASLGPLTLQVMRHRDPTDWWRNKTLGWSWRFGPSPPPAFAATCGRILASAGHGGRPPDDLFSEEEAKRQCRAAALAWGREIVAAGDEAP